MALIINNIQKNMNIKFFSVFLSSFLIIFSGLSSAEEMDHSKHGGMKMEDLSHSQHDTATSAMHVHHGHGAGGFMFEYKFMRMEMDGLLRGSNSVSTRDISGATMGMPPTKKAGSDYMMSPTGMDMDMHMLMVMYGINDDLSIMGMVHYLRNDMDMVMHMFTPADVFAGDMTGSMDTSGLGDTRVDLMYNVNPGLTASVGLSIPTGSIDEKVTMAMSGTNILNSMPMARPSQTMQAPYTMQLGSGTLDLVPSVTYSQDLGDWNVGGQATYTLRTGENDNNYTLGDELELMAWGKLSVLPNLTVSGRINILDWGKIDGADSQIPAMMVMMAPTNDPANSGGTRVDVFAGISGHFSPEHMLSFELGVPIYQDLNGVQMETDLIYSIGYQYMMM